MDEVTNVNREESVTREEIRAEDERVRHSVELSNRVHSADHESPEEIRREIGVDSLAFLSLDGLYEAFGKGPRDDSAPAFTDHCFTGDYPTRLTDQNEAHRNAMIQQLSFLAESS